MNKVESDLHRRCKLVVGVTKDIKKINTLWGGGDYFFRKRGCSIVLKLVWDPSNLL